MHRGAVVVGLLCSAGLLAAGCSFVFVDAPPAATGRLRHFECTSSVFLPMADTGWAAAFTYSALDAVLGASDYDRTADIAPPAIGGAVLAAFAIASATYGYVETGTCRAAKSELERRAEAEAAVSTPGAHR